jgi:hypothetical protein
MLKPIFLLALVLSGTMCELCKCPKKPEKMKWIQLCGKKIHKDCIQEAIYACDYTRGDSNISVYEDCEKMMNRRCIQRPCYKDAKVGGICVNHSCN